MLPERSPGVLASCPALFSQVPEAAKTLDLQGVLQVCVSHIASVKTGHIAPKMQRF
jgi:hypothetical protein